MFFFFGATFEQLSSQRATFDRKAGWDCVRPEKSRPDPFPPISDSLEHSAPGSA